MTRGQHDHGTLPQLAARSAPGSKPAGVWLDAWKAYMRRATNTINYSAELPLAQGVEFG